MSHGLTCRNRDLVIFCTVDPKRRRMSSNEEDDLATRLREDLDESYFFEQKLKAAMEG